MLDGTQLMALDLCNIHDFPDLVRYLEDELDWPLRDYGFDELTFEFTPGELGLKEEDSARIKSIHQLRPLASGQPWGIFFVEFENKKLPVVVLRRILSHLAIKKRASANKASSPAWHEDDLLFITAFGEDGTDAREIAIAHFHQNQGEIPTLHVLGWDGGDTPLKLANVDHVLRERLHWPDDVSDHKAWRESWSQPFRHRIGHIISTSSLLAEELAGLARGIRDKAKLLLAAESEKGEITSLYKAFQTALIHDLTPESFADTYAQTITYGLLTAAISRTDNNEGRYGTFVKSDDIAEMVPITNPFLKEMLQTFLKAGGRKGGIDFDELGIQDVVELLRGDETDLPAILRDFGNKTRGEDPVIHFYEHFLSAYNKQLKIQRGVFYTPQPVVSYIVRSVHELLQIEFGLEDGLASTITWSEMLKKHPQLKLPPLTEAEDEKRSISPDEPFVIILDPATGTATFLVEVINVIHRTLTEKWTKQGMKESQRLEAWNDYVPDHLLPRMYGYELMMAPYAIAHMKIGLKLAETGYRFGSNERVRIYLTNALEPWQRQLNLPDFGALAHEAVAVNEVKCEKRFTIIIGNPPYSVNSANRTDFTERLIQPYLAGLKERYVKPIHDDYIKFVALAQNELSWCRPSIVGMITNNGYLGGVIHRKMREVMLGAFQKLHIVDLHGNSLIKDKTEAGMPDENVFDIQQGVAILLASKGLRSSDTPQVLVADLQGERKAKYDWLDKNTAQTDTAKPVDPKPETYFFTSTVFSNQDEYDSFAELRLLFPNSSIGILTNRDWLVVAFTRDELVSRLKAFFDSKATDAEIVTRFPELGSDGWWDYKSARKPFLTIAEIEDSIVEVLYRPFDVRYMFLSSRLVNRPRLEVMEHMLKPNKALIISRITKNKEFDSCFVSQLPIEQKCAESTRGVYCMPLYSWEATGDLLGGSGKQCGISQRYVSQFPSNNLEDIFHYTYAVFYCPSYRSRYSELLKIDFPRLPLTGNLELFGTLALLGCQLVSLHLLESPKVNDFITRFEGMGDNNIPKKPIFKDGAVWINTNQRFEGVPEAVWNFHVGGYQVCEKWLKDRKGRMLSTDDTDHYQKIVVALSETIRLMSEIDNVIELQGGWPGAFENSTG
jgi:hypothetical protein